MSSSVSSYNLYEVTEEAKNYVDLSESDQKKEKILKTTLTVLGILVLLGVAIGIYVLNRYITTLPYFQGVDYTLGAVFLGVFGIIGGATALGFGLGITRDFSSRYELRDGPSRSNIAIALQTGEFQTIKKRHQQNTYLVRKGFLLPEQADKLRNLIAQYNELESEAKKYEKYGTENKKAIDAGRPPAEYSKIKSEMKAIEESCKGIQAEIKRRYSTKAIPKLETSEPSFWDKVVRLLSSGSSSGPTDSAHNAHNV